MEVGGDGEPGLFTDSREWASDLHDKSSPAIVLDQHLSFGLFKPNQMTICESLL
jgi:hypothetical protein